MDELRFLHSPTPGGGGFNPQPNIDSPQLARSVERRAFESTEIQFSIRTLQLDIEGSQLQQTFPVTHLDLGPTLGADFEIFFDQDGLAVSLEGDFGVAALPGSQDPIDHPPQAVTVVLEDLVPSTVSVGGKHVMDVAAHAFLDLN